MRRSCSEALASRKVVYREVCTEGSEPAKSGTDEQKRNMRHNCSGKQALHCKAQRTPKEQLCRFRRHRRKGKALTGGGLGSYELAISKKSADVIVGIYGINYEDMTAEVERTDWLSYPTKR